jgi:hypothetical protein
MPNRGTERTTRVAERRLVVAERYLKGEPQSSIARDLKLTQSQISLDLRAIRTLWLQAAVRDFDEAKSVELAKVDLVEQNFWAGWQRSCDVHEVSFTKAIRGKDVRDEASVRKEGQAGDPRFLDGVLKCIERRCAILGIDAMTDAMKEAGTGLAALLDAARLHTAKQTAPRAPTLLPEAS